MPKFIIVFGRGGTLTVEADSCEDARDIALNAAADEIEWNPKLYMHEQIICKEE